MDKHRVVKRAEEFFKDAYKYAKRCKWFDVDPAECEIKYMTGNVRYAWSLLCRGHKETLFKAERGISEKDKIRCNTENYYKLFYKNGKLIKVEDYTEGRLSCYYLCFYTENIRVLMPFDVDKTNDTWWHYCIVTWFNDGGVEKEVWIEDDDSQIIYSVYDYSFDRIEYEYANVIPHSKECKINSYERGVFNANATEYTVTESYCWLDEK